MKWNFDNDRAIYTQIVEHIEMFIISGIFEKGTKIPSVRELAADAGVNPNTMQKALSELEKIGLVNTNRTSGKFITGDEEMIMNVKKEFAKSKIEEFLLNMQRLGIDKEETIKLISDYKSGGVEQ